MKKVFLDTNVVIDFLGERKDFFIDAAKIICQADKGEIKILCSSLTYSNAAYILHHGFSFEEIKNKLTLFSKLCIITAVDREVVRKALDSEYKDLEDAMQYYSALTAEADIIVTRNVKDFINHDIPVITPTEFLATQTKRDSVNTEQKRE